MTGLIVLLVVVCGAAVLAWVLDDVPPDAGYDEPAPKDDGSGDPFY